jgi:hypothetical protein
VTHIAVKRKLETRVCAVILIIARKCLHHNLTSLSFA